MMMTENCPWTETELPDDVAFNGPMWKVQATRPLTLYKDLTGMSSLKVIGMYYMQAPNHECMDDSCDPYVAAGPMELIEYMCD